MNPALPAYSFKAEVNDAHLNVLNLVSDTITVSSRITANFSGDDLKNFEGNILLSPTRIIDPRNNYLVDSVYLAANGNGDKQGWKYKQTQKSAHNIHKSFRGCMPEIPSSVEHKDSIIADRIDIWDPKDSVNAFGDNPDI